jgi:uncharacterized protein involved in exopolysaccharide biosynthesis
MLDKIAKSIEFVPGISKSSIVCSVATEWNAPDRQKKEAQDLSAHLANLVFAHLDAWLQHEQRADASLRLRFADSAYHANKSELDSADARLEAFGNSHGVLALKEQTAALMKSLGEQLAVEQQARIDAALASFDQTPKSAQIREAAITAGQARSNIQSLKSDRLLGIAMEDVPEANKEYALLIRQQAALDPIVKYLAQEVAQQRINAQRITSLITVLDYAERPLRKASPHRLSMLLLGFTAGFAVFIGVLSVRSFKSSIAEWRPTFGESLG